MNFHNLQSLISSQKKPIAMQAPLESFAVAGPSCRVYIEPDLDKYHFPREKPAIVLISAVGASGKTALAQELSRRIGIPLLDLAKNKPVGDNTLRGLLTSTFPVESLGDVFKGIATGTFGVIIDGLDEGRSMTSEGAFAAFMDDLVKMATGSTGVSFVLLGREQSIDAAYILLSDRGVDPGIATLCRFTKSQAEEYIDALTHGMRSSQVEQYAAARALILDNLASAFRGANAGEITDNSDFLSFIGYPPVLDAIATLLNDQKNYHKISEELDVDHSSDMEVGLLHRIAQHILDRERAEKVIPIVTRQVVYDLSGADQTRIIQNLYSNEEQCIRLIEYCLGAEREHVWIHDPVINSRYEETLSTFFVEHPFLAGNSSTFRNVIFEAMVVAVLYCSEEPTNHELAERYLKNRKSNYYLVYFLDRLAPKRHLPINAIGALLNSALEFRTKGTAVYLTVDGQVADDTSLGGLHDRTQVEVEVIAEKSDSSMRIAFTSDLGNKDVLEIQGRLAFADISVPCEIMLRSPQEFEITAPVSVTANRITFGCSTLVLKTAGRSEEKGQSDKEVFFSAGMVVSEVQQLTQNGVTLTIEVADRSGVHHPLIQHTALAESVPNDPDLREKYLRLRKLLTHFRSHSKGRMAKYRDKVENERVAGNVTGAAILKRLLLDKILYTEESFYFIDTDQVDAHLGVSWIDLRKGRITDKLLQYLRSIRT